MKVIIFRIKEELKNKWKEHCRKEGITLTDLIISKVENEFSDKERRKIMHFIDKQDNIYAKVENNINQLAKIANAQKFLLPSQQQQFLDYLGQVVELKKKQITIAESIYKFLITNDSKNFKFGE